MTKDFEKLRASLMANSGIDAKTMTVMQLFTTLEWYKEQNKRE